MPQSFTLTLTCAQRPGIVYAVSSFLLQQNCDISETNSSMTPRTARSFYARRLYL